LVIAILIKREIRRGNVKSKRDGHFWWCEFFRKVNRKTKRKRSDFSVEIVYRFKISKRRENASESSSSMASRWSSWITRSILHKKRYIRWNKNKAFSNWSF